MKISSSKCYGRLRRFLLSVGFAGLPSMASGVLDLDGNGGSEIWELHYPGVSLDGSDSDGDGSSNFDEMIAGTNPLDSQSGLRLVSPVLDDDGLELRWDGVAGKVYTVQVWDEGTLSWMPILVLNPSTLDEVRSVELSGVEASGLYRLTVRDIDGDGDGLSAWEECLLGWSDEDAYSSGSLVTADFEAAIALLEQAAGTPLTSGEVLPQRLPDADEAARFLVQTTFGPTPESIQEVMQLGLTGWLDQQVGLTTTTTRSQLGQTGIEASALWWRHAWWRAALVAPDQFRHRAAYALSQIFVVNNEPGSVIGDNAITQASYYDIFVNGAFGTYREVLEDVAYSPTMGFYLSHLNNRKSDLSMNRFPDENFAREVMQLFTIGLWKLNPDGSHQLDGEGRSIPTYDNSVITEMAKVCTGMSHSTTNRGQPAVSFYDSATGDDYRYPMKVWDEEHEPGAKVLFDGVEIPDGQTGEADVQQTLDALMAHESVAPFVSRLLIQRFTSSNPSPAYLRRVSQAWQAGNGNLNRVLRSIVFDPEARAVDTGEGRRGKVREPLLRMIHIMRAFELPDETGKYGVLAESVKRDLGEFVMSSPSVFNFYLPDHSPSGLLNELGLVAPELQIATSSTLLSTHDLLKTTAMSGHWVRGIDYSDELAMLGDTEALVGHLDTLLTYGTLSESTKAAVIDRINGESANSNKVAVAVQTIVTSPEFSILK